MKKLIFHLVVILIWLPAFSQVDPNSETNYMSPNGYFDDIFDHYGNKYKLEDLRIYDRVNGQFQSRNPMLCDSGIFELYFETGSGMEGSSTAHIARRAVICQVFQDLSNFINSPLKNPENTTKVKIWVRDINSFDDVPSDALGMASSFYSFPFKADANFGGIADNEIWKTITLGVDSYSNTASPIVSGDYAINSGIFYHGMMAFNFNSINWNTNLSINAPTDYYDLYTVILHEATHALGIASLIGENGNPVFNVGYNYYSRYDRFLKNNAGNQFLINNNESCSMYNYKFNPSLSIDVLHPGDLPCVEDQSICSSAIKYVGTSTIPVYTPNCFENGSSLSHFEDQCVSPNVNNAYFLLTNAIPKGINGTKRFLKPEERIVLCDIGYSVNTVYGNNGQLSYKNYGGIVCSGNPVAGINDGINVDGTITFMGNANTNILITGILSNDFTTNLNDLRFECLQDIYDPSATFSATNGNSATIISYKSALPGLHLLRYVPYSNLTNKRGNITYIYVFVRSDNNCAIPNACNLVMNGDFEQYSSLPTSHSNQLNRACGWVSATSARPTYYHQDSPSPLAGVPCNIHGSENDNVVGNKGYITLYSRKKMESWEYQESIVTALTSPLLPNTTYQLSYDISLAENYSTFYMKPQAYFSTNLSIGATYGNILIPNPNMLFESSNYPSTSHGWERIRIIIKTGPIAGEKYLYLGAINEPDLSENVPLVEAECLINGTGCCHAQYYIDNIELVALNGASLNIPEDHCQNITLSNLSSYVVSAPSNGVFSGPGVTVSGGVYSFSASTAGLGMHTISYSYTNSAGCVVTISSNVNVLDCIEEIEEPCPSTLIFTTPELATEEVYQAFGTITTHTNYVVNAGSDIIFKGFKAVTLNPDTTINYGSDFLITNENCRVSRVANSTSGIEEKFRLDIYPNPTKGFVTISSRDLKISKVMVTSMEGKIIHTRSNINNYSYDLTLQDFQIGIYSVIVETVDGEIIVDKIIKD